MNDKYVDHCHIPLSVLAGALYHEARTGNKDGMYEGYTPNYTLVYAKADESIVNKIADVRLISVVEDHIIGEII